MTALYLPELTAPPSWRTVDFISDLHLQASDPATFDVWQHYMQTTPADAVFILGDLFEVWVGDDAASTDLTPAGGSFEDQCARILGEASGRLALYFMRGNRDFLVGAPRGGGGVLHESLMDLCNVTLLEDPVPLAFDGRRWLLSHGDALCLADVDYLKFREEVRSPAWQQDFLARPLPKRRAMARELRRLSEASHLARQQAGLPWADVDHAAARQVLLASGAAVLIHGHTHRPALHDLGEGLSRIVLSDWDASPDATPPRAEVLRLTAGRTPERVALVSQA